MKKVAIFGSKFWPGCESAKEVLSKNNVNYICLDITEGMLYLKMFLKYRDNRPEFDDIRKKGRVGVPCIVVNDGEKIIFDLTEAVLEELRQ